MVDLMLICENWGYQEENWKERTYLGVIGGKRGIGIAIEEFIFVFFFWSRTRLTWIFESNLTAAGGPLACLGRFVHAVASDSGRILLNLGCTRIRIKQRLALSIWLVLLLLKDSCTSGVCWGPRVVQTSPRRVLTAQWVLVATNGSVQRERNLKLSCSACICVLDLCLLGHRLCFPVWYYRCQVKARIY